MNVYSVQTFKPVAFDKTWLKIFYFTPKSKNIYGFYALKHQNLLFLLVISEQFWIVGLTQEAILSISNSHFILNHENKLTTLLLAAAKQ